MFECEDNLSSGYHDMFLTKFSVSTTTKKLHFFRGILVESFTRIQSQNIVLDNVTVFVTFILIIVFIYDFVDDNKETNRMFE